MGTFDRKVALITEVAWGQGRSHALALAHEGADIVRIDIYDQIEPIPHPLATEADLEETAAGIEALGRHALLRQGDAPSSADALSSPRGGSIPVARSGSRTHLSFLMSGSAPGAHPTSLR